jgi:hypothetical protein
MQRFHWSEFALWGVAIIAVALAASPAFAQVGTPSVERGRYITKIAGCNDCHTAGYALSGGKVPESEWLKGDALGCSGPWGTTYAPNLRLFMARRTEEE